MGIYLGGQQVVTYAGGVNSDIFATEGYVQEAVAEAIDGLATEEYVSTAVVSLVSETAMIQYVDSVMKVDDSTEV